MSIYPVKNNRNTYIPPTNLVIYPLKIIIYRDTYIHIYVSLVNENVLYKFEKDERPVFHYNMNFYMV